METITNAANAAASYLGYDKTDKETTGDTLGELVQGKDENNTTGTTGTTGTSSTSQSGLSSHNPYSSTSQSGVEPVSGRQGAGTAGQPYDSGNVDDGSASQNRSSGGLTGGLTGGLLGSLTGNNQNSNTGSGLTGNHQNTHSGSGLTGSGLTGSGSGLTGDHQNTHTGSGLGGLGQHSSTGSGLSGSGLTGNNRDSYSGSGLTGHGHNQNTASGLGNAAGYESTSGYGNNTGYDQSTSRGIGAHAPQQGNHYATTTLAGKLGDKLGLNATHRVDDDSSSHNTGYGSTHTHDSEHTHGLGHGHGEGHTHGDHSRSHGLGGVGNVGQSGFHTSGLGSDRSAVTENDRYLFNAGNAPGGGGRHSRLVDDFTDANIHHEGSGHRITGELGSDASSGIAAGGHGLTGSHHSGSNHSGSALPSQHNTERSRRPGYDRMGSGLSYGNASHGLNSGRPNESIGSRLEHKAEQYAPAAGLAGAGAAGYGATHSGREPVSGQRGSGVGGEPYDQGNRYDGTSGGYGSSNRDNIHEYDSRSGAQRAGDGGEPYGTASGVSQATSGVSGLNLNQKSDKTHFGDQNPYDTSNRTTAGQSSGAPYSGSNEGYRSDGLAGAGLAGAGLAGAGHHHHQSSRDADYASPTGPGLTSTGERGNGDGRDFGATAPYNVNDSTFGAGGLKERVAGGPDPSFDDCEEAHHTAHPTGPRAHVDGTHKPTFLNYQHDQFGIPGAKGA